MALMATVEAVFLRWSQVAASRIPTRSLEHLGKPTACLRTMHFRISCGRPDPSSKRGLWGHGRVFPALWELRRLPRSRCPLTATVPLRARQMRQEVASGARSQDRDRQGLPVALNPIRTRWMEHLGRRPPCLRIMPFRTSCGRPDPAAGVVCGTMTRCFRHCGGHDHYRGTVGDTSSSYDVVYAG